IFAAIDAPVTRRGYFLSEERAYTSQEFRKYVANELGKRVVIPIVVPCWLLWIISVIAEWFAGKMGKTSTLNRDKYRIMSQRNWVCDTTPARNDLGFTPQYSLEEGVKETVAWYKKNKWL
ncbi:MAG: NAD(P)-dependent oxidoreductase, partial [Bacteroidaceae bacterium]|nr:NAD(P)-dependent oxidoreductase [Bacteroidaceae bacterium]